MLGQWPASERKRQGKNSTKQVSYDVLNEGSAS